MLFYDFEREKSLSLEERFRLYARRLQLWRLCSNAKCRRACACRGELRHCTQRFTDWAEAVRDCAQREFAARDPETRALRAELETRIIRLGRSLASD
jgi:hypothetical protein